MHSANLELPLLVLCVLVACWVSTSTAAGQAGLAVETNDVPFVFETPNRRAPVRPLAPPPELPFQADRILPLTLEVSFEHRKAGGGRQIVRKTIHRTAERILIATAGGHEWLFERNPVDRRRVSGYLIDHGSQTIIFLTESELRTQLGFRGWLDVLVLGLDLDLLRTLTRTEESSLREGIRFVRYEASREDSPFSQLWWSESQLLPASFVYFSGPASTEVRVEKIHDGVFDELLQRPQQRFPEYQSFDFADWLENH
jgi:hypothetical protein